jgi:hypothetical protein
MSSCCSPIVIGDDSCYPQEEGESKGEAIGARRLGATRFSNERKWNGIKRKRKDSGELTISNEILDRG